MKDSRSRAVIGTLIAWAVTSVAWASGGGREIGNGAEGLLLPNGEATLPDPYYRRSGDCSSCGRLSQPVLDGLATAGRILVFLGAKTNSAGQAEFLVNSLLDPRTEFRFEEIPSDCPSHSAMDYQLPEGGKILPIACTRGWITYLKDDFFRALKLRDQLKLLIHEALHRANPQAPHEHIFEVTAGFDLVATLSEQLASGVKIRLSAEQTLLLQRMPMRLSQLGVSRDRLVEDSAGMRIHPNGGGWVSEALSVEANAYVDLSSRVRANEGWIAGSAEVRNSFISGRTVSIEPEAQAKNLWVANRQRASVYLQRGSRIEDSRLNLFGTLNLEPEARVVLLVSGYPGHRNVDLNPIHVGRGAQVESVAVIHSSEVHIGAGAEARSLEIEGWLKVMPGARMVRSRVEVPISLYSSQDVSRPMMVFGQVEDSRLAGVGKVFGRVVRSDLGAYSWNSRISSIHVAMEGRVQDAKVEIHGNIEVLGSLIGSKLVSEDGCEVGRNCFRTSWVPHVRVSEGARVESTELRGFEQVLLAEGALLQGVRFLARASHEWSGRPALTMGADASLTLTEGAPLEIQVGTDEQRYNRLLIMPASRIVGSLQALSCGPGKAWVLNQQVTVGRLEDLRKQCR